MKIIIIGAGPAGVTISETIRAHDQQAEITVISAEPYPPYSPPAMADHFLHGTQAHLWRDETWAEDHELTYLNGVEVQKINPDEGLITTSQNTELAYDRLVIATGSRLHAPIEGAELPGVYNFKSLTAAEQLIQRVKSGTKHQAVIVGAGFIGMEIALLLRSLGVSVTMVEMADQVMPVMLDADTAEFALNSMRQRGIQVELNSKAVAFTGEKQVDGVQLESGEILQADFAVAASGVQPNLQCLVGSGINYGWGITVDRYLRTNFEHIYAAGDVIEVPDKLTGEIFVHAIFPNAVEQGNIVGLNLLGHEVQYEGADRMNSLKHLELPIMAAGLKSGDDVLQTRHNGDLRTVYLLEDRIVGFQIVGDTKSAGVLRALMNRRENVKKYKDQLLDPAFGIGTTNWWAMTPWYI